MAGNKVRIVAEADDKASGTFDKLRDKIDGFKSQGATGFGLGIGASIGAKAFGVLDGAIDKAVETVFDSIHAASDLRESMTLTEQVFGKNTKAVEQWAGARDDAFSKTEALNYLSQFGNLLQGAGVALDEASDKAEKLTTLAGDLGSAFNTSSAEAADAIKSGLIGESEPLRRFGVILSEAAVQAEAVSMGISKSGKNLTDSEKALARYSLIMKGTVRVQGTFGKDTASLADAQKLLETNVTDLEATLATKAIPTLASWTKQLADAVSQASEAGGVLDQLGGVVSDLNNSFDPQPTYEATTALGEFDRVGTDALTNIVDLLTFWDGKTSEVSAHTVENMKAIRDEVATKTAPEFVSSSREMARALHTVDDRAGDAAVTIATLGRKTGTTADDFKDLNKWAQEAGDTLAEAAYGPEELRLKFEGARGELRHNEIALSNVTDKIEELKKKGKPIPTELKDKFQDLKEKVNEGKQEVIRLGMKIEATGGISMADLRKEFDRLGIHLDGLTGKAADLWWYVNHIADVNLGTIYDNNKHGIGGKAIGGPVQAGTTYLVGEKGPELFTPSMSGTIVPNDQLQGGGWGMPSSGGGSPVTLNINVSAPVLTPGAAEQLAQSIGPVLTRWQQSRGLIGR